jgi:hypothetical protein
MSSYGRLASFSMEELQAEIERRQNTKPKRLPRTDWIKVSHYVEMVVDQLDLNNSLPKDFEQHLMEIVLETMYGKEIFKWWNNKLKTQ